MLIVYTLYNNIIIIIIIIIMIIVISILYNNGISILYSTNGTGVFPRVGVLEEFLGGDVPLGLWNP